MCVVAASLLVRAVRICAYMTGQLMYWLQRGMICIHAHDVCPSISKRSKKADHLQQELLLPIEQGSSSVCLCCLSVMLCCCLCLGSSLTCRLLAKKQSILTPVLSHFPYALASLIQATFWLVLMNCIPPCSLPCLPHRMRFCLYCPEVLSGGDHHSVHCCVCEDQIRAPRSI